MPLYAYKNERGNQITIQANWKSVKELDGKTNDELLQFLKECENNSMLMNGQIEMDSEYHRFLCPPALMFKGSGWHVNDYGRGTTG